MQVEIGVHRRLADRCIRAWGLGILLTTTASPAALGDAGSEAFPLFDPQGVIATWNGQIDVATGDVDGDGDDDVLMVQVPFEGQGSPRVIWLENVADGSGAWTEHTIEDPAPAGGGIVCTTIDGDSFPDLLVFGSSGVGGSGVAWYENPGSHPGGVWTRRQISATTPAFKPNIVDIDGDLDHDIVFAVSGSGFRVLTNNGAAIPTFASNSYLGTSNVFALATGDLDGDNDLDVVYSVFGQGLAWVRNNGGSPPAFSAPIAIPGGPTSTFLVRAIDFNLDGHAEIFLQRTIDFVTSEFAWIPNDGQNPPSFGAVQSIASPYPYNAFFDDVEVLDADGDLDPDLLLTSYDSDHVYWYENCAGSTPPFNIRPLTTELRQPVRIAWGDLGGGPALDVVVSTFPQVSGRVAWFQQASVLNVNTGQQYARLSAAIDAASPGHTLRADPVLFKEDDLDFAGKALTVESRGDLERLPGTQTTPADGSAVNVPDGGTIVLGGIVDHPPASTTGYFGSLIEVGGAGGLNLQDGAAALMTGPQLEVAGALQFGSNAMLGTSAHLLLSGRPGFLEQEIPTGDIVHDYLRSSDLDGDGDVDLYFNSYDDNRIAWLENVPQPNGPAFMLRTIVESPGSQFGFVAGPGPMWHADVNGDGHIDLLSVADGNAVVSWYENNGQQPPSFTPRVIQMQPSPCQTQDGSGLGFIYPADFDGDQDADLLVSGDCGNFIYRNNGGLTPSFTRLTGFAFSGSGGFGFAEDLDDDGDPDIALALRTGGLKWFENTTDGSLAFIERSVPGTLTSPFVVFVADLNGDRAPDLICNSFDPTDPLSEKAGLAWYENLGGSPATFAEHIILSGDESVFPTDAVDLDGDGDLDILVGSSVGTSDALQWLENDGGTTPTFAFRAIRSSRNSAFTPSGADVNGDGRTDAIAILSSGFTNTAIAWFENIVSTQTELASPSALLSVGGALRIDNKALRLAGSASASAAGGTTMTRTASLTGDSVLVSDLDSAGTIRPDLGGMFIIDGAYSQSADLGAQGVRTGRLVIPLSDGMLSSLGVTGPATLAGALRVERVEPFDPAIGSRFDVLSAPAIIDRFDVALFPGFADGRYLRVEYDTSTTSGASSATRGPGDTVTVVVDTLGGEVDIDSGLDFTTGGLPTSAAVGDLNEDGLLDLAVTIPDPDLPESNLGSVVILFNGGSTGGVWNGFASSAQVDVGINPTGIDIGEFDNTNGPDIAVANHGDNTVHILRNGGSGSFLPAPPTEIFLTGLEPVDVVAVDLDGDGFDDIAATTHAPGGSGLLSVRLNLGVSGSWDGLDTPRDFAALTDPTDVDPGDFDNDKDVDVDLAVANPFDGAVSVFVNLGGGVGANWQGFATRIDRDAGASPVAIDITDLDLDGFSDIVASNAGDGTVSVILSEGDQNNDTIWDGSFIPSVELPVGDNARSIASADLDEDGDADLAIVADDDMGEPRVRVLRNDLTGGQLAFAPAQDVQTGAAPILVLAGDVDDDGADDLITVNQDAGGTQAQGPAGSTGGHTVRGPVPTNDVSVALNRFGKTPTTCPGDANGDNIVNFTDLNMILGNFQQTGAPGIPGDLNGDGVVNITDLNIVLGNFQGSCL